MSLLCNNQMHLSLNALELSIIIHMTCMKKLSLRTFLNVKLPICQREMSFEHELYYFHPLLPQYETNNNNKTHLYTNTGIHLALVTLDGPKLSRSRLGTSVDYADHS